MGGSNTAGAVGAYGTMGVVSTSNTPGARSGSASWTDGNGNLWLFGGNGYAATRPSSQGNSGAALNDLWEFSPSTKEWTWMGGSNTANVYGGPVTVGVYGTQGVGSVDNMPGPRSSGVAWTDGNGNFWLFGGVGFDSQGKEGVLNDLWEFSPTTKEWTWVSGSNSISANGVYGAQGVASSSNVPGARTTSSSGAAPGWIDSSGNLWLFGGLGFDSQGTNGYLNDVWEFSTSTKMWTWVCGSKSAGANTVYGTQGVASSNNTPGGRSLSVAWTDKSGNFWLYGGESVDTPTYESSDLWEFNPTTKEWTWVSGSNTAGVDPAYGTQGVASSTNTPGARDSAVGWTDSSGNLWLFGGFEYAMGSGLMAANAYLNDLWEFSPSTRQWTWVGGSDNGNGEGVYGSLGIGSASNIPGARGSEGVPVTWEDSSGNFWLFGGVGYGSTGSSVDLLNDLWQYQP